MVQKQVKIEIRRKVDNNYSLHLPVFYNPKFYRNSQRISYRVYKKILSKILKDVKQTNTV